MMNPMQSKNRFLVRRWPDGCVVFDTGTGNTHALDVLTFTAFDAIQRGDNAQAAARAACHSQFPMSSADESESMARECYERLEKCGLIPVESDR